MFDKDSFVARPPASFHARDRLCFEAIAYSANVVMVSIDNIQRITERHPVVPPNLQDFEYADKILLCSSLWSVVDHTHMLITILKELHIKDAAIESFISTYHVATTMRNKMDHLHEGLNNMVGAKRSRQTLLGVLSYFQYALRGSDGLPSREGIIVTIPFGTLADKPDNFPMVNPAGQFLRDGTSLFKFSAFGLTLEIDILRANISRFAAYLDSSVRHSLNVHIEQLKSEGKTTDGLLSQAPTAILAATFRFEIPSGEGPA